MAIPIIDNLLLATNLPLDPRLVVLNLNDVSAYWYAGMTVFQLSNKTQYIYDGSIWYTPGDSLWVIDNSTLTPADPSLGIQLSYIEMQSDSSSLVFVDMQITTESSTGANREYKLMMDGSSALRIWAKSDGLGGVLERGVVIDANYLYIGDPNTNGSWRYGIDASNNLSFEGRKAGNWFEALNLTTD
jgi:hypothetical protein